MNKKVTYETPSHVEAEDGVVSIVGPDAVDVKLTPEAAEETSHRLLEAAMKAGGQIYFREKTAQDRKKSPAREGSDLS